MAETYKNAGVDIERGDAFTRFIAGLDSPAISKGLGGFSGGFEPDLRGMKHPVLLSTTDGVGTKIMVARELGDYSTIGIDLVAMCVNDLAVCGAMPSVFLDYIACGKIRPEVMESIIRGVVQGCEEAGCTLVGGETAEMPGVYGEEDLDLAGFCTGFVDRDRMLPQKGSITEGDIILGLPSAGIHSNGLSLARKVVPPDDTGVYRDLLKPTRIYVKELKELLSTGHVLAAAHITGGGLHGNIRRVLPDGLCAEFDQRWKVPEIFEYIRKKGRIETPEMLRVFNMGIGIALVIHPSEAGALRAVADTHAVDLIEIGKVRHG